MSIENDIRVALVRIEGKLDEIGNLPERVSKLEMWQAWLKGGWAALVAAYAYFCKTNFGK